MLDGIPVLDLGAPALVALICLLVLTDRLVWHKRLDKLETQIATKDQTIADLTAQNGMLLRSAIPTIDTVLGALQDRAAEGDDPA
jgi:hypothetical protein